MNIEVTTDCQCEQMKHELKNFPRKGLKAKHFKAGEQFKVIRKWNNFFGEFYRVQVGNEYADIATRNAKEIECLKG